MRAWPCLCVAVALAGCGAAEDGSAAKPVASLDPSIYGPKTSSPDAAVPIPHPHARPASPAVARALAAGVVGVVDWSGHVGVRPRVMETSTDGTVKGLTWLRWGPSGAVGRGKLEMRYCNPNCAVGPTKVAAATVTLSSVRTCGGRRYFDVASLRIPPAESPAEGRQPVAYVRAPC
jgi:hypothetical protein